MLKQSSRYFFTLAYALSVIVSPFWVHSAFCAEPLSYKASSFRINIRDFSKKNTEFLCNSRAAPIQTCISDRSTYAGFKAEEITATFLEGKLSKVEVSYPKEDIMPKNIKFKIVENTLTRKFGKPKIEDDVVVIGEMKEDIRTWTSEGITLQLFIAKYNGDEALGLMIFENDHNERYFAIRRKTDLNDI